MPDGTDHADDRIVASLRADRTTGFDLLYRAYAERLFAYAVTVVQDRSAAEDAMHESLISAVANIERLRDPTRLRPWLFSITRNRCLSALQERSRFSADDEAIAMIPVDEDPTAGLARDDSAALVQTALAGLAPVDRDALALALRHDLDMSDIALAMGANQPTARARISRAKSALTGSVTGLLLAREGAGSCAGLAGALAGFTGEWTPLIRKRVAKHTRSCPECDERGTRRATAYVSVFTLPAVIVLSAAGRARADEMLTALGSGARGDASAWTHDGFPRPVDRAAPGAGRVAALVGGAAVLVLVVTGALVWGGSAVGTPAQPTPAVVAGAPAGSPAASAEESAEAQRGAADKRTAGKGATPSAAASTSTPEPARSTDDGASEPPKPLKRPETGTRPKPSRAPQPSDPEPPAPHSDAPTTEPAPTKTPEPDPEPTEPPGRGDPTPEPPGDPTPPPDEGPVVK